MQILWGGLVFCVVLFFFFLVCPCFYQIKINKQAGLEGSLAFRFAFLQIAVLLPKESPLDLSVFIGGWKIGTWSLLRKAKVKEKKRILGKSLPKKKEKAKKERRMISRTFNWKVFFRYATRRSLFCFVRKIWSVIRPRHLSFKGKLGFSEPYYTGLLAAFLAGLSSEGVACELDFTRAVCEFILQIEGRVCLMVLLYYCLSVFLFDSLSIRKLKQG